MQRPWRRGTKAADEGAATKTEGGDAEEWWSWRRGSSYGVSFLLFLCYFFFLLSRGVLYLVFLSELVVLDRFAFPFLGLVPALLHNDFH